jgi:hypothetical protein
MTQAKVIGFSQPQSLPQTIHGIVTAERIGPFCNSA